MDLCDWMGMGSGRKGGQQQVFCYRAKEETGGTGDGGAEGFPLIFTVGQAHRRHCPHCSEGLPEIHCSQRYLTVTRVFCH